MPDLWRQFGLENLLFWVSLRVGRSDAICYKALKFYLLIWMKARL